MSRKHMPLYIGGAVSLALLAGAGIWLWGQSAGYGDKTEAMQSAKVQLDRLTGRKPFPSDINVKRLASQLEVYTAYQEDLFARMSEGQKSVGPVDKDRFRRMLQDSQTRLNRGARTRSVAIPPQFSFGFDRYVQGALPDIGEMPRLMSQLQDVTDVCQILYEAGISALLEVGRTEFEKALASGDAATAEADAAPARRSRRNRGGDEDASAADADAKVLFTDPDGLFTKEHYAFKFRAKDKVLQNILDRLAEGTPFTVITRMELVSPDRPVVVVQSETSAPEPPPASAFGTPPGWPAPPPPPGAGDRENEPLPRELRIVAGNKIPEIRLEVDVYRFMEPARDAEGADDQEEPK